MFLDFDHLMKVLDFFFCLVFSVFLLIITLTIIYISFNANRINFAIITLDTSNNTFKYVLFFFIKSTPSS
jgi:hypothetical protein